MTHTPETRARDLVKRKAARIMWLQENGPCVNCGSWTDLEVDHKDPEQKISHSVWSWTLIKRETELAKCQVLCTDCHRDKSNKELSLWNTKPSEEVTHGIVSTI